LIRFAPPVKMLITWIVWKLEHHFTDAKTARMVKEV